MKYKVIYADPPWYYRDKARAGERGAVYKYPVMSIKEICALPIETLAEDDAVLFMWATWPQLDRVGEVMRAWGFAYKTCAFNWVKLNKHKDTPFMGMGRWTRANSEVCLLGVRGQAQRVYAGISQIVMTEEPEVVAYPLGEHSAKPPIIRDKIVKLCGDVPRIELFARTRTPGWDVWGNQVESDIALETSNTAPLRNDSMLDYDEDLCAPLEDRHSA